MANLNEKLNEDSLTLSGDIECSIDETIPIVVTEVGRSLLHVSTDVLTDIILKQKNNLQSFVPEIKCRLLEAGYQTFNEIGVKWNENSIKGESQECRIERRSFEITMLLQWLKRNALILDDRRKQNKAFLPGKQKVNEYLQLKEDNERLFRRNQELERRIHELESKFRNPKSLSISGYEKKTVGANGSEFKKVEKKSAANFNGIVPATPVQLNQGRKERFPKIESKTQKNDGAPDDKKKITYESEFRNEQKKSGTDGEDIKEISLESSKKISGSIKIDGKTKLSSFDEFDRDRKSELFSSVATSCDSTSNYGDDNGSVSNNSECMNSIDVNSRILNESQVSSTKIIEGESNLAAAIPLPYELEEVHRILFEPMFDEKGNKKDVRDIFRNSSIKPRDYGIVDAYTRKDGSFTVHCNTEENKIRFEMAAKALGIYSKKLNPQPYETRIHHIDESISEKDVLEEIMRMTSIEPYKLIWCNYKNNRIGKIILVLSNLELYSVLNQMKTINIRGCTCDVDGLPIPMKCGKCGILGHRHFMCEKMNIPREILEMKKGCKDCAFRNYRKYGEKRFSFDTVPYHTERSNCPSWQYFSMKKWTSFNGLPPVETPVTGLY